MIPDAFDAPEFFDPYCAWLMARAAIGKAKLHAQGIRVNGTHPQSAEAISNAVDAGPDPFACIPHHSRNPPPPPFYEM